MKFGDSKNPLLISVRSGARISMPGMMDTILNLGLGEKTLKGLIDKSGDERFVYDSYRRFVQMYSDVVLGVSREKMEERISERKAQKGSGWTPSLPAKTGRNSFPNSRVSSKRRRAKISRKTRKNSSGAPSERSSNPG